jgi:ABC-type dipeptide/oligopeptide/nickel transport system ATPase component
MRVVILTGASGCGKTAIAETIRMTRPDLAECFISTSIGVPSPEKRLAWGPEDAWQRAMTLKMARIATMRGGHSCGALLRSIDGGADALDAFGSKSKCG